MRKDPTEVGAVLWVLLRRRGCGGWLGGRIKEEEERVGYRYRRIGGEAAITFARHCAWDLVFGSCRLAFFQVMERFG